MDKYIKIKPEDIQGKYNLDVDISDTVPFQQMWLEFKGRKYQCTKIANEEWQVIRIDEFPYMKLPKDFFTEINLSTKEEKG